MRPVAVVGAATGASFAMILAVCLIGYGHTASASDSDPAEARRDAKDLCVKGAAAELENQYDKAVKCYCDALKIYPDCPATVRYRAAACLKRLGKNEDAAIYFREFLRSEQVSDTLAAIAAADSRMQQDSPPLPKLTDAQKELLKDIADSRNQLDSLLLPKLSDVQKELLEQVDDIFRSIEKHPELSKELFAKAKALLEKLKEEVPAYLPLYKKLATVYDGLEEYSKAISAYTTYEQGYKKLGYSYGDLRLVRQLADLSEARLTSQTKKRESDAASKRAATELEQSLTQKRKTITDASTSFSDAPEPAARYSHRLAIDNDTLIITQDLPPPGAANPKVVSATNTATIRFADIDPELLKCKPLDPKTFGNGGAFGFEIFTRNKADKVQIEWRVRKSDGQVEQGSGKHYSFGFLIRGDENKAHSVLEAIRELAKQSEKANHSEKAAP
jgi:tetratricopeptide (TPR) repeat protein